MCIQCIWINWIDLMSYRLTIVAIRLAGGNPGVCPKACWFLNLLCSSRMICCNSSVISICSGDSHFGDHFFIYIVLNKRETIILTTEFVGRKIKKNDILLKNHEKNSKEQNNSKNTGLSTHPTCGWAPGGHSFGSHQPLFRTFPAAAAAAAIAHKTAKWY